MGFQFSVLTLKHGDNDNKICLFTCARNTVFFLFARYLLS